jgi:hypothetical protein
MNDILGSKVERKGGRLLSSNLIQLSTPRGDIALGASAQGQYGRPIIPTEVFGSTVVYYTQGPSQGTIGVNTVVGENGFFSMIGNQATCELESLGVSGTNECGGSGDNISIDDALLESLGFGWQAGATPVNNSANFLFGSMSR